MKKYMIFSMMATLFCLSLNGQVLSNRQVISQIANENAFLDASSNFASETGAVANSVGKGLVFPSVNLVEFEFKMDNLDGYTIFPTFFDGMVVYNKTTGTTLTTGNRSSTASDVTPGFYYFYNPDGLANFNASGVALDGIKGGVWKTLGSGSGSGGGGGNWSIPVESIDINQGDAASVPATMTLQLTAAINPINADDLSVRWKVISGTAATVDENTGLVTASSSAGTVVVMATANGGLNKYDQITITVTTTGTGTITGERGTYRVYCFDNHLGCWMIDNSKEGTYSASTYTGHDPGERGYYYTTANASTACPSGYSLPSAAQANALVTYINGGPTAAEKEMWTASNIQAGMWGGASWGGWGAETRWWGSVSQMSINSNQSTQKLGYGGPTATTYYQSVRCYKSN